MLCMHTQHGPYSGLPPPFPCATPSPFLSRCPALPCPAHAVSALQAQGPPLARPRPLAGHLLPPPPCSYPHCLYFLDHLQDKEFRAALKDYSYTVRAYVRGVQGMRPEMFRRRGAEGRGACECVCLD